MSPPVLVSISATRFKCSKSSHWGQVHETCLGLSACLLPVALSLESVKQQLENSFSSSFHSHAIPARLSVNPNRTEVVRVGREPLQLKCDRAMIVLNCLLVKVFADFKYFETTVCDQHHSDKHIKFTQRSLNSNQNYQIIFNKELYKFMFFKVNFWFHWLV